jgi:uncharacterized membrane protein YidH (DUF202 family)
MNTDRVWSLAWIVVGAAIFVGGYTMDRLENQHIEPHTVPGLVPALLGVGIVALGVVLLGRSLRRRPQEAEEERGPISVGRLTAAIALCLAYGAGLVGRGMPFWLATAIFVFVSILAFRWGELRATGRLGRGVAVALACALGTAAGVTLVFQELFLVRLP